MASSAGSSIGWGGWGQCLFHTGSGHVFGVCSSGLQKVTEAAWLLNFLGAAQKEWGRGRWTFRRQKQLVIIKIPEHSKAATVEAKGNHLADAAASRAG